jgi:predicted ferric reductase
MPTQSQTWSEHEDQSLGINWQRPRIPKCKLLASVECRKPELNKTKYKLKEYMLYTIAVVLIVLWLLGLVTSYTMGGFIHILLVIAIIMILVNLLSGRKPLV